MRMSGSAVSASGLAYTHAGVRRFNADGRLDCGGNAASGFEGAGDDIRDIKTDTHDEWSRSPRRSGGDGFKVATLLEHRRHWHRRDGDHGELTLNLKPAATAYQRRTGFRLRSVTVTASGHGGDAAVAASKLAANLPPLR